MAADRSAGTAARSAHTGRRRSRARADLHRRPRRRGPRHRRRLRERGLRGARGRVRPRARPRARPGRARALRRRAHQGADRRTGPHEHVRRGRARPQLGREQPYALVARDQPEHDTGDDRRHRPRRPCRGRARHDDRLRPARRRATLDRGLHRRGARRLQPRRHGGRRPRPLRRDHRRLLRRPGDLRLPRDLGRARDRDRRGVVPHGLARRPQVVDRDRAPAREAAAGGGRAPQRARAPLRIHPSRAADRARDRGGPRPREADDGRRGADRDRARRRGGDPARLRGARTDRQGDAGRAGRARVRRHGVRGQARRGPDRLRGDDRQGPRLPRAGAEGDRGRAGEPGPRVRARGGGMKRLAALAAGLALFAAGCGGDDGGSSGASASGGGAKIEAAQQLLDTYSAEPQFSPPGEAFDARTGMQGKKIMEIPITSEIPLTQVIAKDMSAQAKRIGFALKVWENQGKSDQWVQGMQTAIAQHYDAIDLLGIDPKLLKPQIDKARAAGIKVTSSHLAGFGWPVPAYIDGTIRLPYYEVGRVLAAWTIVKTAGKANTLAIVAEDLASTADVVKGIKDEFARDCSACKLTTRNVPTTQWASGVQKEVASGLQRDPNVNYLLPIYDAMTQFAAAGLQVAGKSGTVKMASFNGTPFALEMVADGKLDMNLGENEVWIARPTLEGAMRGAMDQPVPENPYEKAPLLVFTKDNVADAGTPPDPAKGYGEAYEAGFDKLWGLAS